MPDERVRYKKDLANFIPIRDAPRLIQHLAGVSEEQAREDLVDALRDHEVRGRLRIYTANGRLPLYRGDDQFETMLSSLNYENFDWKEPSVEGWHTTSVDGWTGITGVYTIEVSRHDIERLWQPGIISLSPGLTKVKYQQDGDERLTARERRKRETRIRHERWYTEAMQIKKKPGGNSMNPSTIARRIAQQEPEGTRGATPANIVRRLNEHYPGWTS